MMSNHDAADAVTVVGDCQGCPHRYPGCWPCRRAPRVPERQHNRTDYAAGPTPQQVQSWAVGVGIGIIVLGSLALVIRLGAWLAGSL